MKKSYFEIPPQESLDFSADLTWLWLVLKFIGGALDPLLLKAKFITFLFGAETLGPRFSLRQNVWSQYYTGYHHASLK